MIKNPNYVNVAQQVTFVVTSSNGTNVRVRIDNVGVRKDGSLDLVEAKFSIHGITKDNVTRSLTLNQKDFFTMLINGDVASIKFVGGKSKSEIIGSLSGQEITGQISSISIVGSSAAGSINSNTKISSVNTNNSKEIIKE